MFENLWQLVCVGLSYFLSRRDSLFGFGCVFSLFSAVSRSRSRRSGFITMAGSCYFAAWAKWRISVDGFVCGVGRWRNLPTDLLHFGCNLAWRRGLHGTFPWKFTVVLLHRSSCLQVIRGLKFLNLWTALEHRRIGMATGPFYGYKRSTVMRRHRVLRPPELSLDFCGSRHTIRFDRTKMFAQHRANAVMCVGGETLWSGKFTKTRDY